MMMFLVPMLGVLLAWTSGVLVGSSICWRFANMDMTQLRHLCWLLEVLLMVMRLLSLRCWLPFFVPFLLGLLTVLFVTVNLLVGMRPFMFFLFWMTLVTMSVMNRGLGRYDGTICAATAGLIVDWCQRQLSTSTVLLPSIVKELLQFIVRIGVGMFRDIQRGVNIMDSTTHPWPLDITIGLAGVQLDPNDPSKAVKNGHEDGDTYK